jgi:hypothetical protein
MVCLQTDHRSHQPRWTRPKHGRLPTSVWTWSAIRNTDPDFNAVSTETQTRQLERIFDPLESRSRSLQHSLSVFGEAKGKWSPVRDITDFLDAKSWLERSQHSKNKVFTAFNQSRTEVASLIAEFESTIDKFQQEISELILQYSLQLNEAFVKSSLEATRAQTQCVQYWAYAIQNVSEAASGESLTRELDDFNLVGRFRTIADCPQLNHVDNDATKPPLFWNEYQSINGNRGYVLVDPKFGPFSHSEDKKAWKLENDSERSFGLSGP